MARLTSLLTDNNDSSGDWHCEMLTSDQLNILLHWKIHLKYISYPLANFLHGGKIATFVLDFRPRSRLWVALF